MFRKNQLKMSLRRNGFSPHVLLSCSTVNGQKKVVPLQLDSLNPADFDLQKQIAAGIPLKEVSCNLLSNDITDNEISQFNDLLQDDKVDNNN